MDKFLKQYVYFVGTIGVLALALLTFKIISFEVFRVIIFGMAFVNYLLEIINAYQKKIRPLPSHIFLALASGYICAVYIARIIR
ncbi:MAG: hypothetical protein ACLSBL_05200 [Ezakiella massiliensis]